ncbi:hypothetical protein ETC03_17500 [Geobacillus sp. MMMUD3]|nr:hypothetical protein [Geobacillus sp. MMMUD3]
MIENPIISDRHPIRIQEPRVIGYCEGCGGEIYEGDDILEFTDGLMIHQDEWCAYDYCGKFGQHQKA